MTTTTLKGHGFLSSIKMTENISGGHPTERRSEPREASKKFHSIEFKLPGLSIYLFKLKDVSSNGACFLVKNGSDILKYLGVGQILNMRYHTEDNSPPTEIFKSEIKYIKETVDGPFKDHVLIGISILEKHNSNAFQGFSR